jgi:cytochrome c oxidase assembly protein subunit 11
MTANPPPPNRRAPAPGAKRTALVCAAVAASMVGVAFASVPLYDLFCKATGYDGTPLVGTGFTGRVRDDGVTVRFDTNVAAGLPWSFEPETPKVETRLGESKTVFFRVKNEGDKPYTGIAAFNVQPGIIGGYFVKIQCFCFNEQTIQPGETMDFPVVFYVDPAMRDDANTNELSEITLSYTYFQSRNGQPVTVATSGASGAKPNL